MAYAEALHMTQKCYFLGGVLNRRKVFVNYPGPFPKPR